MPTHDRDLSHEAMFRLSLIWQVLHRIRLGESTAAAIESLAAREHVCFDGAFRRVSARSLYRWLKAYEDGGTSRLEPAQRSQAALSKVLTQDFLDFLVREKQTDELVSLPELIRRARQLGILEPDQKVQRVTVYRACRRLGLPLARRKGAKQRDARRFAFPHRMDMVLCDGKHFRAGIECLRRVALFFLDDATRCLLHVVVGASESAELFLRGLYECICKHGLMDGLYLDRGPGFIARDTFEVVRKLDAVLIHGETAYPEGHGKIERFNQTAKNDVLRALNGRPDVDASFRALELRLQHYSEKLYNHHPHEGIGLDTPWQRFTADPKPLRFPQDRACLRTKFELHLKRRVSNDNVVSIDATPYDMPLGYAGKVVILRRRLLEGTIGFLHEGKMIDLDRCDLHANARTPRARHGSNPQQPAAIPPKTAADHSFERDFRPVVDADGGFADHPSHHREDNEPW